MVCNVTLEKSYHLPLTAWRLHHPNSTRPKYRVMNCIVRNQIAPLPFNAVHGNLWAQLWSLISWISHYDLTQPPGTPTHEERAWQGCCSGVWQPQHLQLWASGQCLDQKCSTQSQSLPSESAPGAAQLLGDLIHPLQMPLWGIQRQLELLHSQPKQLRKVSKVRWDKSRPWWLPQTSI